MVAGALLTGVILWLVAVALVHSVTKIKSDLESADQVSLRTETHSAQISSSFLVRRGERAVPHKEVLELQSLHNEAVEGLKHSAVRIDQAKKSLFSEGSGLRRFQFKREEATKPTDFKTQSSEKQHLTVRTDIGSSSTPDKTSKFGLPLHVPEGQQNVRARSRSTNSSGMRHKNVAEKRPISSDYQARKRNMAAEGQTAAWAESLKSKLSCLRKGQGGIFLYHVRKAAGTTIRDVLEQSCGRWHVGFYEVEGLTLDANFLSYKSRDSTTSSLLSVLTLRDPVERAMSMYWYEHVGWWDGIQKKTEKCHSLTEWISTWRDSSEWKKDFMKKNPKSVYVEIENYYVKMLTGWTGPNVDGPLTEDHLELAKQALDSFDVVMLTEWMNDATQIDALNALFPGRNMVATKHMVKGDPKAKQRLLSKLAPNEDEMKEVLRGINGLDLQLFEYAQSLAARRLREVPKLVWDVAHPSSSPEAAARETNKCGANIQSLPPNLQRQLGIHQPPGHKAPL